MINFNVPLFLNREERYLHQAIANRKLAGDGKFAKRCSCLLENKLKCKKALLTTSGTQALELAAILAAIKQGDEVIMPSYTFPSTANAFVLRGAKIVFVDIRPDTMNIDENLIENAITKKTKAIVPVHYGGVACKMDTIDNIARKHKLLVIEDAAQAVGAFFKGKALGTIGDMGCFSFHETKNYTCGEGGAIILNRQEFIGRAEIIREKGTNRVKFFRGEVDKYTWVDIGSSGVLSELNAAYLCAQLEQMEKVKRNRLAIWQRYYQGLTLLADQGLITLPFVSQACEHNGHLFYIKVKDLSERSKLVDYLKKNGIYAVFHYMPLHSTIAGRKYGRFYGRDRFTTKESQRLLRLPLYYGLEAKKINLIVRKIKDFYGQ